MTSNHLPERRPGRCPFAAYRSQVSGQEAGQYGRHTAPTSRVRARARPVGAPHGPRSPGSTDT
jgi:hypothetical protein